MNEKYRLPVVAAVALAAVVVVVVAVVGLGSLGSSATSATLDASPDVVADARLQRRRRPILARRLRERRARSLRPSQRHRKTDDPSLVEPYVTSKDSSAYLTVAGFLGGDPGRQPRLGHHRRKPRQHDEQRCAATRRPSTSTTRRAATTSTPALELRWRRPTVLAPVHVTATLKLVNGLWLMDSYVGAPMKRLAALGPRRPTSRRHGRTGERVRRRASRRHRAGLDFA